MDVRFAIDISLEYNEHSDNNMQACQQSLVEQVLYTTVYSFRICHLVLILGIIISLASRLLQLNAYALDYWSNLHNTE